MSNCSSACVLRVLVLIAGATVGAAETGAAPAVEGCAAKPDALAPPGQHWYYTLDHATRHPCWRLGPLGIAVHKSATLQAGHPASSAPVTPAAAPPVAQHPAAQPPPASALGLPIPAWPETGAHAQVFDGVPLPAPALQAPDGRATGSAEAIAPTPAPAPARALAPEAASKPAEGPAASETAAADAAVAPVPAPATEPADAPAATERPAEAAVGENDHAVALVVLIGALLVMAGAVAGAGAMLGIMRWRRALEAAARAEIPRPPQVRRVRKSAPPAPAATASTATASTAAASTATESTAVEPQAPEPREPALAEIAQSLRRMLDETPPNPRLAPSLPANSRSGQSNPQRR